MFFSEIYGKKKIHRKIPYMLVMYIYRLLALFKENSYLPYFTFIKRHNFNTGSPFQYKKTSGWKCSLYVRTRPIFYIKTDCLHKGGSVLIREWRLLSMFSIKGIQLFIFKLGVKCSDSPIYKWKLLTC